MAKKHKKRSKVPSITVDKRLVKRAYQSTQPSNYRPHSGSGGDANAVVGAANMSLRRQARYADENNDNAHAILDTLVTRTIGRGLIVEPQVLNNAGSLHSTVNDAIEAFLAKFALDPDVTGMYSQGEAERLSCRTWLRDGEMFTSHIMGEVEDIPGSEEIPYRFQLLEPDHIPADLPESREPRIIQGVQLNRWGRPVIYHVSEEHPEALDSLSYAFNTRPVLALQMSHLAFRTRISQLRGVSILAPILDGLIDTHDLCQSERIAHKLAARLVGFLRKGSPDDYDDSTDAKESDADRLFELSAGSLVDNLRAGEDIELLNTKRDAVNFAEVYKVLMRKATGATMTSYSSATRDYDGSYSSQRQEQSESRESYLILLDSFVQHNRRPVHQRTVLAGLSTGAIPIPSDVDTDTLFNAVFYASRVPSIDEQKEANANKILIETKQASVSELIRLRGKNPREVARQIEADKVLFPQPKPSPALVVEEEPEDEDDEDDEDEDSNATNRQLAVVR